LAKGFETGREFPGGGVDLWDGAPNTEVCPVENAEKGFGEAEAEGAPKGLLAGAMMCELRHREDDCCRPDSSRMFASQQLKLVENK
jgi:hypothetical protein